MERYSVYRHTTPDGKIYVGITKRNPLRRWRNGIGYRDSHNPQFWQAICQFGWENIRHEIIFSGLSREEAENKEIELIAAAQSAQKQFGFNITAGGPGALGRKCSENTKSKIGDANRGHECSAETKIKLSIAMREEKNPMFGRTGNKSPRFGVTGITHPLYGKTGADCKNSKRVMNITTGEIYVSASDAAQRLNLDNSSICACCRGRRKTCGSYEWKFI